MPVTQRLKEKPGKATKLKPGRSKKEKPEPTSRLDSSQNQKPESTAKGFDHATKASVKSSEDMLLPTVEPTVVLSPTQEATNEVTSQTAPKEEVTSPSQMDQLKSGGTKDAKEATNIPEAKGKDRLKGTKLKPPKKSPKAEAMEPQPAPASTVTVSAHEATEALATVAELPLETIEEETIEYATPEKKVICPGTNSPKLMATNSPCTPTGSSSPTSPNSLSSPTSKVKRFERLPVYGWVTISANGEDLVMKEKGRVPAHVRRAPIQQIELPLLRKLYVCCSLLYRNGRCDGNI